MDQREQALREDYVWPDIAGGLMRIREAAAGDADSIERVHLDAFGAEEQTVAALALALIGDESAKPVLILVAESDEYVVGNVIFSSVHIIGAENTRSCILAPLAVAPKQQRSGVGTRLVERGLARLRELRMDLVFVYGDPSYYGRFGFSADHHVRAPFDLAHPQGWMALSLGTVALDRISGRLVCADSLNRPEHW
jgi:predicted N-acetyltransferase YhbS